MDRFTGGCLFVLSGLAFGVASGGVSSMSNHTVDPGVPSARFYSALAGKQRWDDHVSHMANVGVGSPAR